jgi:hypothetical protein
MLSEAEQRRLTEIGSELRLDDPVFVQRFNNRRPRPPWPRWRGVAAVLAITGAMVAAAVGLVLGSVGTVVVALTAFGASVGMWITHCLRS